MTPPLRAEVIADAAPLLALEADWWDLFGRCPAATPFRSPAWLLPWWQAFAPGPLRVVTVRRGGDLVALAPLYLEESSRRLLPLGIGVSDDLDMLVAPGVTHAPPAGCHGPTSVRVGGGASPLPCGEGLGVRVGRHGGREQARDTPQRDALEGPLPLTPLHKGEGKRAAAWRGETFQSIDPRWDEDAPDDGHDVGAVALETLARFDDWDVLSLEELAPGSPALAWAAPRGWSDEAADQSRCPVIAWGDDARDIGAVVPPAKLRKLRMARRRADRRGAAIEAAAPGTVLACLDALFRLHAARWESRGEGGVLADPAVRAFHRLAAPRLAAAGLLHATLLRIDGQVAGAFYGLRRRRSLFAYLGGFDPAFAFESPGTLLMGDALEAMMRDGAGTLDLLRGQESYKYEWGAVDRIHRRRTLRRPAP